MKKYVKPSVKVVNLKSSNDIAAKFENIRDSYVKSYLLNDKTTKYSISVYSNTVSLGNGEELPKVDPVVEG